MSSGNAKLPSLDLLRGFEAGADEFLSKPYSETQLQQIMETSVSRLAA